MDKSHQISKDNLLEVFKEATDDALLNQADISPSYYELKTLHTSYRNKKLIGQGALKMVYECEDLRTSRQVALAELRPHLEIDYYDAFIHEARLMAGLNHPHIIKVYEVSVDEQSGRPYFTMDLRSNKSLLRAVKWDLRKRLDVFSKVCDGMAYAHSQGTIHLDLKPENIQCEDFGEVVICDWGLGCKVNSERVCEELDIAQELAAFDTLHGAIRGTPGYMAPEQIQQGGIKDEQTDIFSLGCILYLLLTGCGPYDREGVDETLDATLRGDITPVDPMVTRIDPDLLAIAYKAMSPAKEERYSSVQELRNEIIRFLSGYAPRVAKVPLWRQAYLLAKRHRKLCAGITAFFGLSLTLYCYYQNRIEEQTAITEQAKVKTVQLAEQVSTLNIDFDLFKNAVSQSQLDLPQLLGELGIQTMYDIIGVRDFQKEEEMLSSYRKAAFLLDKALEYDEDESGSNSLKFIYEYWVMTHFCMMNFEHIVSLPLRSDSPQIVRMYAVAQEFHYYNFGEEKRPTIEQIKNLMTSLIHNGGLNNRMVELMINYDEATRKLPRPSLDIRVLLLRYLNRESRSLKIEQTGPNMVIQGKGRLATLCSISKKPVSILEGLEMETCTIRLPKSGFNLSWLDQCDIQHLDLSGTPQLKASRQVDLSLIKEALLPANISSNPKLIKQLQRSNGKWSQLGPEKF